MMKLTQTSTTADANELGNYIVSRLHVFGFAELLCRPVWFDFRIPSVFSPAIAGKDGRSVCRQLVATR